MPTHSPVEACPLLLISLITRQVVTAPYIGKVSEVSVYRIIGTALGGFWGLAMFSLGLYLISPYGSGVFVSLTSPLLVLTTTWFAFLAFSLGTTNKHASMVSESWAPGSLPPPLELCIPEMRSRVGPFPCLFQGDLGEAIRFSKTGVLAEIGH
jgi:hypothetical protein